MKGAILVLLLFSVLFVSFSLAAPLTYNDYEISTEELELGYTNNLAESDKFIFTIDGENYFAQALSVFTNSINISVSKNNKQTLGINNIYPEKINFEVTIDDFYDVSIQLNEIDSTSDPRTASLTIKKINEKIPDGVEPPYSCTKFYDCPGGTRIQYCEAKGQGCSSVEACDSSPADLCPVSKNLSCTDSDGGMNYFNKGKVDGFLDGEEYDSRTDHCGGVNSELLEEFFCDGDNIASVHSYE
jgi:hypothetical protein